MSHLCTKVVPYSLYFTTAELQTTTPRRKMCTDVSLLTCVKALGDGGGIDEEATAKTTTDVGIELVEWNLQLSKPVSQESAMQASQEQFQTHRLKRL